MTATLADVLTSTVQAEAALGWDRPPSLDYILRQENGDITLQDLGTPPDLWVPLPPHLTVTGIAAYVHQIGFPRELGPESGELIGVAIHTEAWAFLAKADATEEEKAHFAELADLMERESIAGHPEAVETKAIMAVTDDGQPHMVSLRRDTREVTLYYNEGGVGVMDGRMHHALGHLLDSFKEVFA